jgi:hypothetical protein
MDAELISDFDELRSRENKSYNKNITALKQEKDSKKMADWLHNIPDLELTSIGGEIRVKILRGEKKDSGKDVEIKEDMEKILALEQWLAEFYKKDSEGKFVNKIVNKMKFTAQSGYFLVNSKKMIEYEKGKKRGFKKWDALDVAEKWKIEEIVENLDKLTVFRSGALVVSDIPLKPLKKIIKELKELYQKYDYKMVYKVLIKLDESSEDEQVYLRRVEKLLNSLKDEGLLKSPETFSKDELLFLIHQINENSESKSLAAVK